MLLAYDARVQDAGSRGQRVHRRINAQFGNRTGKVGGRIQMGEGRGGGGIGVIVRRHVDGLDGCDRTLFGGGNPLLQLSHFGSQVRLVSDGGWHAAQQRGDLGTGLREPEDIIDEQQHVLSRFITEVLGHGQRRQPDPQARARRLGHLPVDQSGF